MEISLHQFSSLYKDMRTNNKCIEQFYVRYSNITFDVIIDIGHTPFELLIGAINHQWACTLKMNPGFKVEMSNSDFYSLCDILNLKPGKESLTSFKFLLYIANHAPKQAKTNIVHPSHLARFRQSSIKKEDEPEKIYFRGWNNHQADKRTARNFDKTEKFFGKDIADVCRRHNISSIWSAYPQDENKVIIHPKHLI